MKPFVLRNLQLYSASLVAFLIPISKLLSSYAIVIWFVASLIMWSPKRHKKWVKTGLWAMIAFYAFHITGLIHTENLDYGLADLGIKASFIIMPIAWLTAKKFTSRQSDLLLGSFTVGVLGAALFELVRALISFISEGSSSAFFYVELSHLHPSYSAMYALFAIAYLTLAQSGKRLFFGFHQKWLFGFLLAFLLVYINLLASKAGVLIAPVIIILLGVAIARYRKSVKKGLVYSVSLIAIYFCSLFFSPQTIERFSMMISATSEQTEGDDIVSDPAEKTTVESTAARMAVWESSIELIRKNIIFGTGTGDVKDELALAYTQNDYEALAEKRLNPHNQYFQTWAAIGIPGIASLLLILIAGLLVGWKYRKELLLLLVLIITANILVESMFEVQSGIVFFAFFYGLLMTSTASNPREIK